MTVSNISYEQQFFDNDLNKVNDEDSKYSQGLFLLATQGNIFFFFGPDIYLTFFVIPFFFRLHISSRLAARFSLPIASSIPPSCCLKEPWGLALTLTY